MCLPTACNSPVMHCGFLSDLLVRIGRLFGVGMISKQRLELVSNSVGCAVRLTPGSRAVQRYGRSKAERAQSRRRTESSAAIRTQQSHSPRRTVATLDLVESLRKLFLVDTTQVGHVLLALMMAVHATH